MNGNEPNRPGVFDPDADSIDAAVEESSSDAAAEQEVQQLTAQLADARDKMLRAQAELDNYRKRARRELEDERRYAEIYLLRDLLPVIDNVSRAIDAAEKQAEAASLLEGFKLTRQQLTGVLDRHQCKEIAAQGEPFDPALHEALMQQPSADLPDGSVLGVLQPGYQLHDRVVRPAQVIVSKKP